MNCRGEMKTFPVLMAVVLLLGIITFASSADFESRFPGPCLATLFKQFRKSSKLHIQVDDTMGEVSHLHSLYQKQDDLMVTYIKIREGTILEENILSSLSQAFGYLPSEFHKQFIPQYGTANRVFRVLATPRMVLLVASKMNSLNIEWIKRVPSSHRISIPIVDVTSFKDSPLQLETTGMFSVKGMFTWMNNEVTTRVRKLVDNIPIENIQQMATKRGVSTRSNLNSWMKNDLAEAFSFDIEPVLHSRNRMHQITPKMMNLDLYPSSIVNELNIQLAKIIRERLSFDESIIQVSRSLQNELKDEGGNTVVQGGRVSELSTFIWENGITGKDQVVSYIDTGINAQHCYFLDTNVTSYVDREIRKSNRKIIGMEGEDMKDLNGHGSHVGGIIAGSILTTQNYVFNDQDNGIAKNSKLYAIDFSSGSAGAVPTNFDFEGMLNRAYNSAGARIHSNSWGCKSSDYSCDFDKICYRMKNGVRMGLVSDADCLKEKGVKCHQTCLGYSSQSVIIDQFLFEHDDMIIVHATGNNGNSSLLESLAAPATSKNALAVGASNTYYTTYCLNQTLSVKSCRDKYNTMSMGMPLFSGKGPTLDGRNKPDVLAPGDKIISADVSKSCGMTTMSGTSMATPAVAGAAALVREYLTQHNLEKIYELDMYNNSREQTVSGTLIKALLVNSAQPFSGKIYSSFETPFTTYENAPNPVWGYGEVNLVNTLKFTDLGRLKIINRQVVSPGKSTAYLMTLKTNTVLRLTLTWYDRPGQQDLTSNATKLINNLDLGIYCSNGDIFYGNGAPDSVNNVEQVDILTKSTQCLVIIFADSNNVGDQKFSCVITSSYDFTTEPFTLENVYVTSSNFTFPFPTIVLSSTSYLSCMVQLLLAVIFVISITI